MLVDPDFDFELFPPSEVRPSRVWTWVVVAAVVACWFVDRPSAVVAALVAVATPDVREGRRLARAVPDPAGARICALFRFAWGAWKVGAVGFGLMFALIPFVVWEEKGGPPPGYCLLAALAWMLGFLASAGLTAAGMIAALRSEMRVWIGEGVNQARTLLLGMTISAFTIGVLVPCAFWLINTSFGAPRREDVSIVPLIAFSSLMFVGPVVILGFLDRISRRVVAARPGKFGPKVPSVGKWNV